MQFQADDMVRQHVGVQSLKFWNDVENEHSR
jgi:hypothetical protein